MIAKAKGKKNKYISYTLRFGVAAIALYIAFRGEDLGQVAEVLLGLKLWVLAAVLAIFFVSQLIFVARWNMLLRVQSIKIGFWSAVRLHLLGLFYNNCLPTSVGGDFLRAWYVTRHTDKKLEAALSVFVDRAVGLTGMFIMAFSCYWFIPAEGQEGLFEPSYKLDPVQLLNQHRWTLLTIAAVFGAVFVGFMSNAKGRGLLRGGYGFVRLRGTQAMSKVHDAIRVYYNKKLALAFALLLTFCCQGVFIIGMWLAGRELGMTVHTKYYFIFFPVSWLLGTIPISVGGLGIMEGGLKVMFSRVSMVSDEHILALALCQRFTLLVGSLPGVVIHLIGAHLPKEFFIDYNKPIN
ncbi:MAG: flippase-like domain-containing protein [Planctomycetota bacterium]|nr:MAG: flippase-like domain-containing protein [Planctomycetota bacterium]